MSNLTYTVFTVYQKHEQHDKNDAMVIILMTERKKITEGKEIPS